MARSKKMSKEALANRGYAFQHVSNLRKACNNLYGVLPRVVVHNYPFAVEAIFKTSKIVRLTYSLTSRKLTYVDLDSNYSPSGVVTTKNY